METRPRRIRRPRGWTNPWPGALVQVKSRTRSTMEDAFTLARSGCPSGSVVVAGHQSQGRGRVPGRSWVSPAWHSLLATFVLHAGDLCFPNAQLPLRVGVAAALAVEQCAGVDVRIKWPNDLMVAGRKLAGILCEIRGEAVLVGVGINCAQASFPPELADSACSLRQVRGDAVELPRLLELLLLRLRDALRDGEWLEKLRSRLHGLGQRVTVDLLGSGKRMEGLLKDVEEDGRLVLELDDGTLARLAQGEVSSGQ